jgi:magnesium-protoporphyrin O-methyltransferase
MSCAQCEGIEAEFDERVMRKKLRRYRRRGPDRTTRLLIEDLKRALGDGGSPGPVLLDIGAGLGAIHHDLLDGHVSRAVHVDASSASLRLAREETARRGHGKRVEFVPGDFVAMAGALPAADLVTLDRVICCYDDMDHLVTLAAQRARRMVGAVYPRDAWWMRVAFTLLNRLLRLKRSAFRVFVHEPRAIDVVLRSQGLERRSHRLTLGWEVVVYLRRDATGSSPATA